MKPGSQLDPLDERRLVRLGMTILGAGLGGFLLWAGLAPLDEGVPAPAVIAVDTQRKTIQHQGGGTISKVFVKEAQAVKAGDVLIQLDDAFVRSRYDALEDEWKGAQAQLEGKQAQLKLVAQQLEGTRVP